ncbi:major facilitator superfamily transporter [Tritrichomonas foetus]|uniref:Major facilitator superfamily transporter n=1 Tax=Tritrichomonas foetus TaxID=1144522 RepID=A0A1J4JB48_9EUKA|nr:major facilitator superfamily transporter [Tritrichomonas foetus]|eukprot:OHS96418.1 major facilitator superfamily transporter [Tritrichomonas foetus]
MGDDWVPLCKRERLPLIHVLGIAAATLAGTLLWTIVFALFNPLASKLYLSNTVRTVILLMGSLIGFLVQPIVGVISDGLMMRWGRRRIFMIIGGLFLTLALFLMMFCVEIGTSINKTNPLGAQQGFLIFGMILTFFAGNILQGPARTLCSDVCPPQQQVLMSSICGVYGGVGGVFTNLIGALSLYQYTSLTQEQFILVVCLSISFFCVMLTIFVTHEEPLEEKPSSANPFAVLYRAMKEINSTYFRIAMVYFMAMIASYQIGIQLTDFMGAVIFGGNNELNANPEDVELYQKGVSWAMMCQVVSCGVQFLYGFVNSKVCDIIGLKWVFFVTLTLLGVMYLLFFFVKNRIAYIIMHVPIGVAVVCYNNLPPAVVTLITPTEKLGAALALLNCFNVIGQQVSNFGIGMGVAKAWPGKPGHLVGISCIFAFLGAILCFWLIVPESKPKDIEDISATDSDESSSDQPAAL